jgi:hypothetical protein
MTAIAYRSGLLAADTLCGYGTIKAHEPKIIKKDGYLLGIAGNDMPSLEDVVRWFFIDLKAHRRNEFKDADFTALVVTPAGRIQAWHHSGLCQPITEKFWAIGSGRAVCMGAMERGATSPQAVAAAIKWADSCGGRVLTRKLKGK